MLRPVMTTYLEMRGAAELQASRTSTALLNLMRAEIPCPELNRFLYTAVGARWFWYARLTWDYAQWLSYLDRPELETWIAYISGSPAGYYELERQGGGDVEIVYLGLLPGLIGQGLGSALLTSAVNRAWAMGAIRVWVHTCSLDHPLALRNYQARGFRVFRTEETIEGLPEQPLEPWPGAAPR